MGRGRGLHNAMSLIFLGNPALRRVSSRVQDVQSSSVRRLLERMEEQVRAEDGVGIAAPQLGANSRMFLMLQDAPASEDDLGGAHFRYQAVINPEIVSMSPKTVKDFEGCLSIPGYVGIVRRAREIAVRFEDEDGRPQERTFRDFPARIFQHEFDHLEGILYVDRLEKDSLMHNEEFRQLDPAEIAKMLRDP